MVGAPGGERGPPTARSTSGSRSVVPRHREVPYALARKICRQLGVELPTDKAAELEAVARAESKSVTDAVRDAIDLLIAERRQDKAFRVQVREIIEEDRAILDRLAQ